MASRGGGKYVIRYTGPRKGVVLVTTVKGPPPVVTLPNGQTIVGTQPPGISKAEETPAGTQYQWVFPGLDKYMGQPFTVSHAGQTSAPIVVTPQQEMRTESGGLGGLDPAPNKAYYGSGGAGGGAWATGGMPAYLGGGFPQFQPISYTPIQYTPIQPAPYNLIDPEEFAEKYSKFNTQQFAENFQQSGRFALEQLQTELQGLRTFVPAAAALKRQELAADNLFNQAQRDTQIRQVLPDVQAGLKQATADASVYARGRLISDIEDRALELGLRSEAADIARTRGFGDSSVVGRKLSDLLSARERFQIAQYGNQLKESNALARQQLELAPLSYSDAGQQIRVMPEEGAGRAQARYTSELGQYNLIPTTTAFQTQVSQEQFKTNLEQKTNEFNALNKLETDRFNATMQVDVDKYNATNSYAAQLGKFNYDVGYANMVAGQQQAEINQQREDAIRQQLTQEFQNAQSQAQRLQAIQSLLASLGYLPGLIDLFSNLVSGFGFGGGSRRPVGGLGGGGGASLPPLPYMPGGGGFSPITSIPAGSSVPDGYMAVSTNIDGTIGVAPITKWYNPYYQAYLRAMGVR